MNKLSCLDLVFTKFLTQRTIIKNKTYKIKNTLSIGTCAKEI